MAGSNRAVLALIALLALPRPGLAREAVIEVNDSATDADDYLCWSPVHARVKLAVAEAAGVPVTLACASSPGGGAVRFQADAGARPDLASYAPLDTLSLTLPADGSWASFWVMGSRASVAAKDAAIVADDGGGNRLGSLPVMVRVRKDAETLSATEINLFLAAVRTVHDMQHGGVASGYVPHVRSHDEAFNAGIHNFGTGAPLFLAWHRAFLLNLERQLQAVDARVALPYWRFDEPAPRLFTKDFIGRVPAGGGGGEVLVELSPTNPLFGWEMFDGEGGLVRADNGDLAAIPAGDLDFLIGAPINAKYRMVNGSLETSYHNDAHMAIGGWLGTGASPRDPLFYLLHANVDRGWAHWQAKLDRFGAGDLVSYSAQGSYPGTAQPSRWRKGSYAMDVMWPWSGSGGDQGTADQLDDWPLVSYPMPAGSSPAGLKLPPTPASMVDYLDVRASGGGLCACYDDIGFKGGLP